MVLGRGKKTRIRKLDATGGSRQTNISKPAGALSSVQPCMASPFGSGCCWVISGWTEGGLICSSISSQSSDHCDQRRVSQNFAGRVRVKLCSHSRRVESSEFKTLRCFLFVSLVPPDIWLFHVCPRFLGSLLNVWDAQMLSQDNKSMKSNSEIEKMIGLQLSRVDTSSNQSITQSLNQH